MIHFVRQNRYFLCKTYIALAALLVDVGLVGLVGVAIGAMSPPPIAGCAAGGWPIAPMAPPKPACGVAAGAAPNADCGVAAGAPPKPPILIVV